MQLRVPDKDYLLREGGKGFPEEFQQRVLGKVHAFARPGGERVGENQMEVELKLKDGAQPPQARSQTLNLMMLENLKEQIKEWEDDGVIEPSSSEFSSPLMTVRKKTGKICWAHYGELSLMAFRERAIK